MVDKQHEIIDNDEYIHLILNFDSNMFLEIIYDSILKQNCKFLIKLIKEHPNNYFYSDFYMH